MIRLIVAMDRKRGIARHGSRPWDIPDDMAYFVEQTKSHGGVVLVGGTTFRNDLKGKPLAQRITYVLTKNNQPIHGVQLVHDLRRWFAGLGNQDVWVIGGANVYEQVMKADLADELYITQIDADLDCDQFFPEYEAKFHLDSQSEPHEQNGFHFTYSRYTRT